MNDNEALASFRRASESQDTDALGRLGEKVWSNIMLGGGFNYIPLCELPPKNGQGPRMRGCDTVLPDFDANTRQRRFYLDAKCKSHYAVYRNAGNEKRHGIGQKYWHAYSDISIQNTQRAMLGVVELFAEHGTWHWSGSLLAQTLGKLGRPHFQHGTPIRGFKDMVFWPVSKFRVLAVGISPSELMRMAHEPVSWRTDIAKELLTIASEPEFIQANLF